MNDMTIDDAVIAIRYAADKCSAMQIVRRFNDGTHSEADRKRFSDAVEERWPGLTYATWQIAGRLLDILADQACSRATSP
jgi:hypothetical protein